MALHRKLGITAAFVAAALVISGYMTAVAMARRGLDLSGDLHIQGDPLLGIVNPLGDLVPFVIVLAAGYWFRNRTAVHKLLMLLATVMRAIARIARLHPSEISVPGSGAAAGPTGANVTEPRASSRWERMQDYQPPFRTARNPARRHHWLGPLAHPVAAPDSYSRACP